MSGMHIMAASAFVFSLLQLATGAMPTSAGGVRCGVLFRDGLVLQAADRANSIRGGTISGWGATPTDKITLATAPPILNTSAAKIQADGSWSIGVTAAASATAYTMVLSVNGVALATAKAVHIGDVFICGGQSTGFQNPS